MIYIANIHQRETSDQTVTLRTGHCGDTIFRMNFESTIERKCRGIKQCKLILNICDGDCNVQLTRRAVLKKRCLQIMTISIIRSPWRHLPLMIGGFCSEVCRHSLINTYNTYS